MKMVALILLVVGIGLSGTGVYLSYFIEEQTTCPRYLSEAETKLSAAKAAAGTPREAALKEETDQAERDVDDVGWSYFYHCLRSAADCFA